VLTYETRRRINRPPDAVFDLIGTHVYENHPSWESEVVEIRPLTDPPVQLGSRAIMVRREYGRRSEVAYDVTEFELNRKIGFRHVDGPMSFEIAFLLEPSGEAGSDLTVQIRAHPKGAFRLLTPLIGWSLPKTSERITSQMVAFVEQHSTEEAA
jgi:hypothetical protein